MERHLDGRQCQQDDGTVVAIPAGVRVYMGETGEETTQLDTWQARPQTEGTVLQKDDSIVCAVVLEMRRFSHIQGRVLAKQDATPSVNNWKTTSA